MRQEMYIKTAQNGLLKANEELCKSRSCKNIDHDKKIRSTFSHEKLIKEQ